jgi:hypothetical protein
MWIFTRYGFFSVSATTKRQFMVRARAKKHLELLRDRLPFLKDYEILETTTNADYPFRIVVPRNVWVDAMMTLTIEQHWPNFKAECKRFRKDAVYENSLNKIWSHMRLASYDWKEQDENAEGTIHQQESNR